VKFVKGKGFRFEVAYFTTLLPFARIEVKLLLRCEKTIFKLILDFRWWMGDLPEGAFLRTLFASPVRHNAHVYTHR
jgi:hypothetical protein